MTRMQQSHARENAQACPVTRWLIVRDGADRLVYFIRIGLGIFWECTHNEAEARKFSTRAAASKVLIGSGKNRQGWRVVKASVQ